MPEFDITSPTGQQFRITAPEGASQEEVLRYAQENMPRDAKPAEPAAAPQTPRQRSGPLQSPMERVATGGVMGFAAPEAMAALGRGLMYVPPVGPLAVARPIGLGLQAAAPLVRMGGRFLGAAGGAAGGLAGGAVESATRSAGASPALADMLGNITEIGTGLPLGILPAGRAMRASTAPREYPAATPEQLRASVGGAAEDALASAQQQGQTLRRNQLRREIETRATGRAPERQPTDPDVMQQNARQGAQLPEPINQRQIEANEDVDYQLRRLALIQERAAETTQQTVGDRAYARFNRVAAYKQLNEPFGLSRPGQGLQTVLDDIIAGGTGPLQTSTREQIDIAKRLRAELFPEEGARPVDFRLVETRLRDLRQLEASKDFTGYTGVQRQNYGSAADAVEDAIRTWVGAENYPRAAYAQGSEALNLFRTRLGEALTSREAIPYSTAQTTPGMFETPQGRLRGVVYNDADSVRFASELFGEQQVHGLGVQHASDMIKGKTAEQVTEWLDSPANSFVDAIPGLRGRLNQYAQRLAADEGRSAGMTRLQDQLRTGTQTSRADTQQSRAALDRSSETIRSAARSFANAQPEQMLGIWNNIKPRLEGTGLFSAAELDNLERMVGRSASDASREERVNITREIGNEITRKLIGKVVGTAIGAETIRRVLGF
jgi:hypothetical protein